MSNMLMKEQVVKLLFVMTGLGKVELGLVPRQLV